MRGIVAWGLAVGSIVAFFGASLVDPRGDALTIVMFGGLITSSVAVGALLIIRVPGNPVGALLLTTGVLVAVFTMLGTYSALGALADPPRPGAAEAAVVTGFLFVFAIAILLIGVPLVFPDGRLPSPRYRWIVGLAVAAVTAQAIATLLKAGPVGIGDLENPYGDPDLDGLVTVLEAFANGAGAIALGGAAAAVIGRFRGPSPVVRTQVKWLVAVAATAAIAFPLAFVMPVQVVADVAFFIGLVAMVALPLAIGIAVLRYRLYEIDRIVSRSIAYAAVTAILTLVFGVTIVATQWVLAPVTSGQTVPVAASTLAVFALFQPLRRRVQRVVDHRFDRARYDAERTAQAFAERLRDETDLAAVTRDLTRTTRTALAPSTLGIWIRDGGAG
jgi:hypothetical protein